jgi:hypothetical protein
MIPLVHGIIKHGFGQGELEWKIRELCAPLFSEIWNVPEEDLLCSFDGGCFLNSKIKKRRNDSLEFNLKDLWIHVDTPREELTSTPLECYQGVVNFADSEECDGGLVLVENSKNIFADYMEAHPSCGYKWTRSETVDALFDNATYIKVCAPVGHLILWNSLMFHCNVPPTNTDPSVYRMCTYVSMQPRAVATKKELEKRIKLYEEGRMTGHWTYGPFFEANPKKPRTYGNVDIISPPEVVIAKLNPLRARLIGYETF